MKYIYIFLAVLSLISVVSASNLVTQAVTFNATNGANCAVFHGIDNGVDTVWFSYSSPVMFDGTTPVPLQLPLVTDQQIASGSYQDEVCDGALAPGTQYVVEAEGIDLYNNTYYGSMVTFTMPSITPIPTTTYSKYLTTVNKDMQHMDWATLITVDIWNPLVDSLNAPSNMAGPIFWGLLLMAIFLNIGIKQNRVYIPILLFFVIGSVILTNMVPKEWLGPIEGLMIMAVLGLIFMWFYRRRG